MNALPAPSFPLQFAAGGPSAGRKHTHARSRFTQSEDERLRTLVNQLGNRHWETIAQLMPGRTARQCRDRYKNYLLDSLVSSTWRPEEDQILRQRFAELGPKWVEISKSLQGRSGNDVKNRWYKHLAKGAQPHIAPRFPTIGQPPAPMPGTLPLLAAHPAQGAAQFDAWAWPHRSDVPFSK
jgi:hypothetical protein